MALSRLYTFVDGAPIVAAQHNEELNQIIGLLAGTTLTTVLLKSSSAGTATLGVDVTGGGKVAQFFVNSVEKSLVNAAGQFESVHATGTAPFVVASTTKVTNLNADLLDDKTVADLLLAVDPVISAGGDGFAEITFTQAAGNVKLENNATALVISNSSTAQALVTIAKIGATPSITVYGQVKGITPVAAEDLTRKDFVELEVDTAYSLLLDTLQVVTGLSGGTDGRAVRWSTGTTWTDALQSATIAQATSLLMKSGGEYYMPGNKVGGLSGLVVGSLYYLGSIGDLTTTEPTSGGVTHVCVGRALSATELLFTPTTPKTV